MIETLMLLCFFIAYIISFAAGVIIFESIRRFIAYWKKPTWKNIDEKLKKYLK